jgi:hypothetical protein
LKKYSIPIKDLKFKEKFPCWSKLIEKASEKRLSLKEVEKYVGLTKRQIDYWIEKDVLSPYSRDPQKWKRFSLIDLFLLAVAFELRSRGTDISKLPVIRAGLYGLWYTSEIGFFAHIIDGEEVLLCTDLEHLTAIIPVDVERSPDDLISAVKTWCKRDTTFLVCLSLKKICDSLARKLELSDFKVNILAGGQYEFIVNEVPLRLEALEKWEEATEVII